MTEKEMLAAAAGYGKRGWAVHPLHPPDAKVKSPGKQAILNGWQTRGIATDDELREWFSNNDYNIGLVCGESSGVIVIDYDHNLFWGNIIKGLGSLTLQSHRTEGRGHAYFKYTPEIKSQKHHLLGIEILSTGSNAVLPPSRHATGDLYTWVNPDIPVVEIPPILLERLTLLFQVEENLVQQMGEVRPCFKKLWNGGFPETLHEANGREAMLAWAAELKARGASINEILMLARLIYKDKFDSRETTKEWNNIKTKPWRCSKIKERLSGVISCTDCPIKKKRENGAGNIKIIDIANKILSTGRFLTFIETEEIFYYTNGSYHPYAEAEIKKQSERIRPDISTHWNNEIISKLKVRSYKSMRELDKYENYIHLDNGLLNINTMELEPHSPDKIVMVHIPVEYNPDAVCPNIARFFKDILDEGDIPSIEEFFGYCLLRNYLIQKLFMLVGGGSNGKSTLLTLLNAFLGSNNVVSLSIRDIIENKFAAANLFGKLANTYADLSRTALAETGRIKMLTGGDTITAERKFGGYFSFVNYAKMIFSANRVPLSYDESDAFFRRWVIINFPNTFNEQQGRGLLSKLTTPDELSGLLNIALKGLRRLLDSRRFSNQRSTNEIREQYIRMSDSIQAFIWDRVEISPDGFIPKKDLYHAYTGYCRSENIPIASEKTFFMRFPIITRVEEFYASVDKKRVKTYKGILLKMDFIDIRDIDSVSDVKDVNHFPHSAKIILNNKTEEYIIDIAGIEIIGKPEHPEHPEQPETYPDIADIETKGNSEIAVTVLKSRYDTFNKPDSKDDLERLKRAMNAVLLLEDIGDGERYVNDYCRVREWYYG